MTNQLYPEPWSAVITTRPWQRHQRLRVGCLSLR